MINQSPHMRQATQQPPRAAITNEADLERLEPYIKKGVAILMLLISTFGNYICFVGGWERTMQLGLALEQIALAAGMAVCYQIIFSTCQFVFRKYWWAPGAKKLWYHIPLWGSVIPALLGYGGLVVWYVLGPKPDNLPLQILLYTIVLIIVTLNDIIPEQILVEH